MDVNVLVLNQDYQAITVTSVQRAFVLVFLKKAELVVDVPQKALRSVTNVWSYPSIIRLFSYIHIPYKKVSLTRQNIYKRDGSRCVYCKSVDQLTLDHVFPKALGGKDSWQNLVTACQKCNTIKGSRLLAETELTLNRKPFRPSFIMYLRDFSGALDEQWKPYLMVN